MYRYDDLDQAFVNERVAEFRDQTRRFLAGELTEDEFKALAQCGLTARDILRMLTVAPAARFGVGALRGTVTSGKMADLVVLDGDPITDISAFSRVRFTIRNGRVIYERSR